MKQLIQILRIAANTDTKADRVLTVGHLLNICLLAEKLRQKEQSESESAELKQHLEILEEINPLGQD